MAYKVKHLHILVPSSTKKKVFYDVERFGDGKEACNCRGWQMTALRSAETGKDPYCRHLEELPPPPKRKYVKRIGKKRGPYKKRVKVLVQPELPLE